MRLSEKVQRVLKGEGISLEELALMLRLAAITSREGCNRRYHHWLFRVNGDEVSDMRTEWTLKVGRGKDRVTEEHDECQGQGCKACGWSGQAIRYVSDKIVPRFEPLRLRAS
jgi:hypothetical protein